MSPTLFSRIIQGEIPGTFVYRDELCVAFMTISPITTGHVLVVPIQEVDEWTDLSDSLTSHLFAIASKISNAQKTVFLANESHWLLLVMKFRIVTYI